MSPGEIEEALAALRLSRRPGIGAARFKLLLGRHGSARAAEETLEKESTEMRRQPKSGTEAGLERAQEFLGAGGTVLVFGSPGYPPRLSEMSEPPPVLFVRGGPEILSCPLVAVVGARECSETGLSRADEAVRELVERGFGIASGGARGIDGRAHASAIQASGFTVAALGTGVDVVYPASHRALFESIATTGALVSELLPGTPPAPKFFPTRNRIIAGLSLAVIVIEGRKVSGSLSTARWAMKLGRPVAVPRAESGEGLGEAATVLREQGACVYATREELSAFVLGLKPGALGPSA